MAILGTNSQGIATSVLSQWVAKVSDLPLTDSEKEQLDTVIDGLYAKVGECNYFSDHLVSQLSISTSPRQLLANS